MAFGAQHHVNPEGEDHVKAFSQAVSGNQPSLALYHLEYIVRELVSRVEDLEGQLAAKEEDQEPAVKSTTAKKASSRKTTKSSKTKKEDSED